ncbi:hypothetical protein DERP_004016 [Dermatophagoides pteronyssinus]|uniref:Uncharacterized protein n=1 Tax=Dermatophagoides pteronyssinus TaxID=6956 RepID=A0ABQ8J8I6_DERPT|nr:hypothetical protein DERP_004016 [Dermatophagoides pteronyssinus]
MCMFECACHINFKMIIKLLIWMWILFPIYNCSICQLEYSSNRNSFMVYAADNLQNGTIRLYGEKYYIDFQLYHHYDNYTGSILSIQDSTNETQRLIMFAIEKRLIRETYFNLSEKINFLDTVDQRITVFTLIKHQYDYDYNIGMDEYTFIVVSKRSTKSYLTADWYHIKTNNGTIQDSHLLPPRIEQQSNQTMNETNIFIRMDSAFRLLFDDEQYLFTIINRRLFWTIVKLEHFDNKENDVELVNDSNETFHRGPIPPMTAAFTIQSENLIALVIIKCHMRCIVPWIYNESIFDFQPCLYLSNWYDIEPFILMDNETINNKQLKRFSNDNRDSKLFLPKQSNWFGIFYYYGNRDGIGHRIRSKLQRPIFWVRVNYRIMTIIGLIMIVLIVSLTGFTCYEHRFQQNYYVAEQEFREEQRLQQVSTEVVIEPQPKMELNGNE